MSHLEPLKPSSSTKMASSSSIVRRMFGDISIIKGELDRLKLIEVRGLSRDEVVSRLLRAIDKRS